MSTQESTSLNTSSQSCTTKCEENKPNNQESTAYNPLKQLYPSHLSFSTPLRSCLKTTQPKSQYDKISSSFPPSKILPREMTGNEPVMNLSNNHAPAESSVIKKLSYSDTRPSLENKHTEAMASSLPSYDQHLINSMSSGNQWACKKLQDATVSNILTEQLNKIKKSTTQSNNQIPSKMKKLNKKKKKKERSESDIDQKIKALKREIFSRSNLSSFPGFEEEFLKRKKSVTIVEPSKEDTNSSRNLLVRGSIHTNEPQSQEVCWNPPNQVPVSNQTIFNSFPNDENASLNFSPNNYQISQKFQHNFQENSQQQISRAQLIKELNFSQQKLKQQQAAQQLKEIQEQLQAQLQLQLQRQVEQQQLQQLLKQKQDQVLHQQLQQQLKQHEQLQKQQQLKIIQQLQMQQKLLQQSSQQRQIEQQQKLQQYQQQLLEILKQNQSKKENLDQKSLENKMQQQQQILLRQQQKQNSPNSTWREDPNSLSSLLRDQKNISQPQANGFLSELLSPVSYHSTLSQRALASPTLVNSSANSLIPLQILPPNNIQPLIHTPTTLQLASLQATSLFNPQYRLVPSIQQTISPFHSHYSIAHAPNQLHLVNTSPLINMPNQTIAYQPIQNPLCNDLSILYNTQNNNNNDCQSFEADCEEGSYEYKGLFLCMNYLCNNLDVGFM